MSPRVVVVGGGHAGTTLAALLRQGGHRGEIIMFGDEVDFPYHRPPLSKKFVDGELEQWLRPAPFYTEQRIDVRLGERVSSIDRADRRVHASSPCPYDVLVLATGARPRDLPVPGVTVGGVVSLRTLEDARALRKHLTADRRVVIIGGGYIGLEVAAAARANGVEVTIVEREQRVLARVASEELSAILASYHRERGTTIITGAQVRRLTSRDGQVRAVVLDDGTAIPCDVVVVGVGAVPRDELAVAAGLDCDQGIVVDGSARTSDSAVFAIGDVTRRPVPGVDGLMRLESIPSATEQARQVSAAILGAEAPAPEVPWFWSDQFDLKLKIAGVVVPGCHVVRRGEPASGRFALLHHDDAGAVTAVETANAPGEFMAAKKLLRSGHAHSHL
ncbi:3-phenylpropionate/trans-cinnamate dioxygenase ferredoxin reductase subunit [Kribbella sp. VKM Ac-2527]|uniref:3-phenylpropionate/trans-cinnamate dioxygenase ferredoxin reductase subunit n=1 Tax=Kribbella caucasensis TaxID=2512215 RepID=A0A4V3C9S1_9ACTN|nr:FAD-dependent oxidoreductase [Kribbella sp. VKM Ac-2527]TDO46869.1 3-phenylpropionate/trans-cinnamate dioxygenase ferredoxin reductase subunit [Kribbella sp. VKM Ac-2527]